MGLFQPAWQGRDLARAEKAVDKEISQDVLFEIARTAPLPAIQERAARRITDQSLLFNLAMSEATSNLTAVSMLTDRAQLAFLAGHSTNDRVRVKAYRQLDDQAGLADIAHTGTDRFAREEAIEHLTDQALLTQIARSDEDTMSASAAATMLYLRFNACPHDYRLASVESWHDDWGFYHRIETHKCRFCGQPEPDPES